MFAATPYRRKQRNASEREYVSAFYCAVNVWAFFPLGFPRAGVFLCRDHVSDTGSGTAIAKHIEFAVKQLRQMLSHLLHFNGRGHKDTFSRNKGKTFPVRVLTLD